VDGRPETEWMAARRQRGRRAAQDGCACGDGGVSSRAQNGARGGSVRRPGAHGDGRSGQRSGTRMIFFWRSESHVMGRGSGMTTAVSRVSHAAFGWG
jgi:hypothetical protein